MALHGAEVVEDARPAVDEGSVAAGEVVEAPEAAGERTRVALAADDEAVGRGLGDVLGHAEIVGRGGDVLAPVEGG